MGGLAALGAFRHLSGTGRRTRVTAMTTVALAQQAELPAQLIGRLALIALQEIETS